MAGQYVRVIPQEDTAVICRRRLVVFLWPCAYSAMASHLVDNRVTRFGRLELRGELYERLTIPFPEQIFVARIR